MTLIGLLVGCWALTAFAPALARVLGARAGWPLAAGLLALAGAAVALGRDGTVHQSMPWIPSIDVSLRLRLDGLSLVFVLLVLVVGAVVIGYSTSYLRGKATAGYYALMVGFAAAMTMLVLADDLILMFVSWELTTLCSYLLILRSGPDAAPSATRTLLITVGGGLSLLAAVSTIVVVTGTTRLSAALADPAWSERPAFATTVAVLVAVAAMTKSAQFPFHAWLPDAMVAPAPVSAYLHAAAMVKAGIYLLLRFADAASHAPVWSVLLIAVGLITSVMGAVFALQRTDLKALLAYSTVSHLGLLTLTIGIGTTAALTAAIVHVVAHACFKSAGFMYVGLLEQRTGTREIHEVSGLARSMPVASVMIVLAVAAMAGLPPTFGFVSKELILDGVLHGRGWWLAIAVALSAAITVAYCGRMLVWTLPGRKTELRPTAGTRPMVVAVSITAVLAAGLGAAPGVLDGLVGRAIVAAGGDTGVHIELWHGLTPALGLSVTAIVLGVVLILARRSVERLLDRRLFPGSGVAAADALQRWTIDGGRRIGDLTRTDAPATHLAVPITLIGVIGLGGLLAFTPAATGTAFEATDIAITIFVLAGVVAAITARTPLSAVISVGIVGFSVAVWFFALGASDVALTQLLVEILTVVIMVLALRHLPDHFPTVAMRTQLRRLVPAAAAGTVAMFATLVLTGRPELSAAGEWFVRYAEAETGGSNIVNTILVDFRALDTFGELVVLAVAALSITALLHARRQVTRPESTPANRLLVPPEPNMVFIKVLGRVLVPLMIIGSVYALLRGHNAPGGGFIAALIGAAALAMHYLAAPTDDRAQSPLPYLPIAGAGIAVAAITGFIGLAEGSFLRPLHGDLFGYHFTTALVFDLGVYLAVFGVILGALNQLGIPRAGAGPAGDVR
ncbi:cation:proton antiporter [Aeromicrobium sp. PE09-221]|uniref:hydrogen gas-evolving membrane-bound hydrogenase subunit E n=1 Tax=Aeromicrobium sp. PE09-221 TaxID=1898043 RepID=UPI000B3E6EF8|nr:hydrogen gas-evolving membrane-bound hydrogenase subunit E [Aeromicrobium sp. PE09-221]OUZ06841.1 cation:proton antiporter [Aeromicrobium sp. PE09-221]